MNVRLTAIVLVLLAASAERAQGQLAKYVNPFLGTAPLTDPKEIGFQPPWRVWAGLVFPGASVPNAMVQLSPITRFGSGAGYEYENPTIRAFAHTNKGHWNLCNIPMLPAAGEVDPDDFASTFSHANESAHPGYYQVLLERHKINAELTSTLRCGYHRYTYAGGGDPKLIVDLALSNEKVTDWKIDQDGDAALAGFQHAHEKVFFYAVANRRIRTVESLKAKDRAVSVVTFEGGDGPVEVKVGLSFVSTANARENLAAEIGRKTFDQVRDEAAATWEALLAKVSVTGGTDRQRRLFYSCLYRSFLWPALRSDANGDFLDEAGHVARKGFRYYTLPSLWDDYRNKLVLLDTLAPDVATDVIRSLIDRGQITGFIPTFFHGDHAAPFIAGSYLRGLRDFDVAAAYRLLLRNATVEGGTRPYIKEYMERGYVSTPDVPHPRVETKAKAGVTKTLEYAYDDYAVALLARELHDEPNFQMLMRRSRNYKNVFDPSTELMRGRLANGDWVTPFNPQYPYYEYMYREANAWQSSFFAPHDSMGLIGLYKGKADFEAHLDALYSIPWNPNYIADNINCFIGQYCHGNQPDHGFTYLYYFVDRQEKAQAILDTIMDRFYGMGQDGNALCGMDDAGEMSAWYVYNAIGLYPYSPADEAYIVTVPLFDTVALRMSPNRVVTIRRRGSGRKITDISYGGKKVEGYFVPHHDLMRGADLVIQTR